jgi:hypothetical protein
MDDQGPQWRKSSLSFANGDCVEVAVLEDAVLVRHSKHPSDGILRFTLAEWRAFTAGVLNGEFDHLPD